MTQKPFETPEKLAWWKRAGFAAAGAVAPDILLLYSKRFTMPSVQFVPSMYALATVLYVILAGTVTIMVVPPRHASAGRLSFGVGFALPCVVAGLATAARSM